MSQVDEKTVNDTEIVSNSSSNLEDDDLDFNSANEDNAINQDDNDESDYDEEEDAKADAAVQKANANASDERKVELDLDEAPFLEEEKEEEPEVTEEEEKEEESKDKKKKFQLNLTKKKIIIIAAIALIIIGGAVAALFLLGGGESEEPTEVVEEVEEVVEEEAAEPEGPNMDLEPFVVIVEEFKEPQGPPVYTENLDPFWIEMKDDNNETIFLVCNFALVTGDEAFYKEIQANIPEIRDTIYYYLAARDYKLLTNHENFPLIKEGMLTLVNRLLKKDQLTDVLYDSYITK